jgi:hypothetical protein
MKIESACLSGLSNLPVTNVPMFLIRIEAIVHHLAGHYIKVSLGVNPVENFVDALKPFGIGLPAFRSQKLRAGCP